MAPDIKGSRSWLVIGPVRVQPAEFAKLGTALMLAYWLNRPEFKLTTLRGYLEVFAIILLPMAIIILQSETGSALVFCAFFLALYREGLSGAFLLLASLAVTLFVVSLMLADVSWGATDASRLLICSIISAATILYLSSIVRWKPRERRILCIVTAVYFVGMYISLCWLQIDYSYVALVLMSCIILFCFGRALLRRIIARKSRSRPTDPAKPCSSPMVQKMKSVSCSGTYLSFVWVPVIGIPLPFFSYGGSSLWGFSLMLALFLKIDASGKR